MEDIDLKETVLVTLDGLTNQFIAEILGISQRSAMHMKKGFSTNVDFLKLISFIELALKDNGLIITDEID